MNDQRTRPLPSIISRSGRLVGSVIRPSGDHALLMRNAYALMANTMVTGLLGLAYWILAARYYAVADVGRASAAYSAMNLFGGFTGLALIGGMTRFIPQAGSRTGRLIKLGYGASVLVAVVGSVIFLVVTGGPGSSYSELNGMTAGVIFTACVAIWSVFTLQDGVLVGMRAARWVTTENGVFGVAKIAMLLPLAAVIPRTGLYVSWMVPTLLALPLVNWLIFRRLLPGHVRQSAGAEQPSRRQVGRFLAGDVTGALLLLATVSLVPVLVAMFVPPRLNAYFYMAWAIGSIVGLLTVNMAQSLTVEGAFDPVQLARHTKAALRRILLILVPVAAGTALLAPWILGLFGPGYARYGTEVLVLLAVSTLPRMLTEMHLGVLRAQSRTSLVALVQGARAVLTLGLALVLTKAIGITGAGLAVLIAQVVTAVAVTPGLLRVIIAGRRQPAGRARCRRAGRGRAGRAASSASPASRTLQGHLTMTSPAGRWPSDWPGLAAIGATGLAGLLLFLLPLAGVKVTAMNGLGLISVLPVACMVGIALLVGAFIAMLALRRPVPLMLGATVVAIVFCLDGVTSIIEPVPRFATTYQVAGFVSYISHTGHVAPAAAAYFSWPGFFALIAFATRAAGVHSLLPLMTWWPVAIDLLLLAPFMLATRALRISWQARWLAALLFCVGNWVGQDYFSPQSLNFLFYLSFIAIVLTWFSGRGVQEAGQARPKRIRGELPSRPVTAGQRAVLLLLLIAIFAASTVSHQLTPAFMLVACAGLVLVGRCTPRGLPILLGVLLVGWVSYETVSYWSGHISTIFGGVGGLRGTVSSSVGHRLIGTRLHRIAIFSRVVLPLIMAVLVAGSLFRRWRRRIADRALIVLLVVPLIIIGLQNYGGEIALRVYLFMLPAVAVLAAALFFPGTGRPAEPAPVSRPPGPHGRPARGELRDRSSRLL